MRNDLEYVSPVWNPNISPFLISYNNQTIDFNTEKLNFSRMLNNVTFVNILKNLVSVSELLAEIKIYVPDVTLRRDRMFCIQNTQSNNEMMKNTNDIIRSVDTDKFNCNLCDINKNIYLISY